MQNFFLIAYYFIMNTMFAQLVRYYVCTYVYVFPLLTHCVLVFAFSYNYV